MRAICHAAQSPSLNRLYCFFESSHRLPHTGRKCVTLVTVIQEPRCTPLLHSSKERGQCQIQKAFSLNLLQCASVQYPSKKRSSNNTPRVAIYAAECKSFSVNSHRLKPKSTMERYAVRHRSRRMAKDNRNGISSLRKLWTSTRAEMLLHLCSCFAFFCRQEHPLRYTDLLAFRIYLVDGRRRTRVYAWRTQLSSFKASRTRAVDVNRFPPAAAARLSEQICLVRATS